MFPTKPLLQETAMGSHTHVRLCGGDRHTIGWSNAQNLILPFYSCLQDLLLCFKTYLKLISAIILKSLTLGNIETQHTFKLIPHFFCSYSCVICLLELRDFCVCYHIEVNKWKFVFFKYVKHWTTMVLKSHNKFWLIIIIWLINCYSKLNFTVFCYLTEKIYTKFTWTIIAFFNCGLSLKQSKNVCWCEMSFCNVLLLLLDE